jgi:hypothetical protein
MKSKQKYHTEPASDGFPIKVEGPVGEFEYLNIQTLCPSCLWSSAFLRMDKNGGYFTTCAVCQSRLFTGGDGLYLQALQRVLQREGPDGRTLQMAIRTAVNAEFGAIKEERENIRELAKRRAAYKAGKDPAHPQKRGKSSIRR